MTVAYDLVSGDRRITQAFSGTGFFVSAEGLLVTNKHVVEPWEFEADSVALLEDGYRLDISSVRRYAWRSGSRVRNADERWNFEDAFSSRDGTLTLAAIAPDSMEERVDRKRDGTPHRGRFHRWDNGDLALLRARVDRPVLALPLASDLADLRKLEPVMVLGFPGGAGYLESGIAETAPSRGTVRKIEDTLFIDASILGGDSGGPVIDRRGRVVGVATRQAEAAETFAACIQSRHVLPLLSMAS